MENISQAWNDITIESAEFVLQQAEKRLQATIDTARMLTDRAVTIMQFSIPLSIGLGGLILTTQKNDWFWLYVVILGILLAISYLGLRVFDLYDVEYLGHEPRILLDNNIPLEEENQNLALMIAVITLVQIDIEENTKRNFVRAQHASYAVLLVKALLLSLSVLFATAVPILVEKAASF
jgi:hypothetical protein